MLIECETHVKIHDSVMGSGKSSYAIQYFNDNPDKKFIYICLYKTETRRIQDACPALNFKVPEVGKNYTSKAKHFQHLVENQQNISSTHALFEKMDDRTIAILKEGGYHLVIDEALSVLNNYSQSEDSRRHLSQVVQDRKLQEDVDTLIEYGALEVTENSEVRWVGSGLSAYDKMRGFADRNILYYIGNSTLMWSFPPELFHPDVFESVWILTYQFERQIMSQYLNFFEIEFEKYYVRMGEDGRYHVQKFDDTIPHEKEFIEELSRKINIIEDKELNEIGDKFNSLSYSWWKKDTKERAEVLNKNITHIFRYRTAIPAVNMAWTCFKSTKDLISGKYLSKKNWLPFNARAVNEFRHKKVVAYCVNRYYSPITKSFFLRKDIVIDDDDYALSEMLQLLWRFAIREGEEITVYIPSSRMRGILKAFLNNDEPQNYKKYI